MGVDSGRIRAIAIVSSTLMTASAVSISGMIGWIGLVVPHLARMLVGPSFPILLPASLLLGARSCFSSTPWRGSRFPIEIPIGILTAIIGRAVFRVPFGPRPQGLGMKLAINNMSAGYGSRTVISEISVSLCSGEVVCLLGPNGSGKTTFFKAILGLIPSRGDISLDQRSARTFTTQERARALAYVPQIHIRHFRLAPMDIVLMEGRRSSEPSPLPPRRTGARRRAPWTCCVSAICATAITRR